MSHAGRGFAQAGPTRPERGSTQGRHGPPALPGRFPVQQDGALPRRGGGRPRPATAPVRRHRPPARTGDRDRPAPRGGLARTDARGERAGRRRRRPHRGPGLRDSTAPDRRDALSPHPQACSSSYSGSAVFRRRRGSAPDVGPHVWAVPAGTCAAGFRKAPRSARGAGRLRQRVAYSSGFSSRKRRSTLSVIFAMLLSYPLWDSDPVQAMDPTEKNPPPPSSAQ